MRPRRRVSTWFAILVTRHRGWTTIGMIRLIWAFPVASNHPNRRSGGPIRGSSSPSPNIIWPSAQGPTRKSLTLRPGRCRFSGPGEETNIKNLGIRGVHRSRRPLRHHERDPTSMGAVDEFADRPDMESATLGRLMQLIGHQFRVSGRVQPSPASPSSRKTRRHTYDS